MTDMVILTLLSELVWPFVVVLCVFRVVRLLRILIEAKAGYWMNRSK